MPMAWFRPSSALDKIFEGGIILKGLSGLAEFIGGFLLLFISPAALHNFITAITQRDILREHDKISAYLLHLSASFGQGSREFLIIYLWIHAAVKIIAVIGLLRNKAWAFPFSLISLGILTLYQIYDIVFVKPSIGMIMLTLFDFFILWLIWREYGKFRENGAKKPT
jgi:uncharacterized membrane protein